jgi:metal-sulfur cluster biosynthetic enzyme
MTEETPINPLHWDIHDTHPELVEPLRTKLQEIVDPEIGLNVIQLGLVRKVSVTNQEANLYILLTTPFCPYGPAMLDMIKEKSTEALNMPVTLQMGMEAWDFSMMEDPGALDWGMYG